MPAPNPIPRSSDYLAVVVKDLEKVVLSLKTTMETMKLRGVPETRARYGFQVNTALEVLPKFASDCDQWLSAHLRGAPVEWDKGASEDEPTKKARKSKRK